MLLRLPDIYLARPCFSGKLTLFITQVEVEDQCCPVCMADWLSAVNPKEEGFMNKPLELTCAVKDGADISGGKVSW